MSCLADLFVAAALTLFVFIACAMVIVGIMGMVSYFKNED